MVNPKIIEEFFELLNSHNIKYVLIKNDRNLIPNFVKLGDDIDILVHPNDYNFFVDVMKNNGYNRLPGESKKYFFVYKLKADIYLQKKEAFFHAYDKLSCISFTNMGKSRIPLDNYIQNCIWETRKWDKQKKWWIMDDKIILLYLIVRSLLDKRMFREKYIEEIKLRNYLLDDSEFKKICSLVFFKFTNTLIELLKNEKYESIFKEYQHFCDY